MDLAGESSKAQLRRVNKPLLEKRRRARINACLNQLKNIVLETLRKDTARYSKLEKADILEMTVDYLRSIRNTKQSTGHANKERLAGVVTDSTSLSSSRTQQEQTYRPEAHAVESDYGTGYRECAAEIRRYLHLCQQLQKQQYINAGEAIMSPDVSGHLQCHLERILSAAATQDDRSASLDDNNNNNETTKSHTAASSSETFVMNNVRLPDSLLHRPYTAISPTSGMLTPVNSDLSSSSCYRNFDSLRVNAVALALPVGDEYVVDSCRSLLAQSSPTMLSPGTTATRAASATGSEIAVGLFSYGLMQVAAAATAAAADAVATSNAVEDENMADRLHHIRADDSIRRYLCSDIVDVNDGTDDCASSSKWPSFNDATADPTSPAAAALWMSDPSERPLPPVSWNSVSSTSSDAESSSSSLALEVWRPW